MGADIVLDFAKEDVVESAKDLTRRWGVGVAIEALGTQPTFESALRVLRPGETLSSPGVYSGLQRADLNLEVGPERSARLVNIPDS
jgi:alcohol dehydrogenase